MIIGIGGISRSGKSFIAEKLLQEFASKGQTVSILDQDEYVLPIDQIPLIRDHTDWEIPNSIDWEKYHSAICEAVEKFDIVIAEGLMVFWDESISRKFDKRIIIELSKTEFVARKRIDLRWGKEPEWYIEHIWESFLKYGGLPVGIIPDIVLNGENSFDISEIFRVVR